MQSEQTTVQPVQGLHELRPLMPVVRSEGLYLDHAAAGVLPQPAVDEMIGRIHSAASDGVRHWNRWQKLVQRTRRLAADLVGGHEEEIAFVPNTAAGIGIVAEGFRWQAGDNVVLSAGEFPSNRFPWLNLKRRGIEVRLVDVPEHADGVLRSLEEACDARTKIVACSWVDYATGQRRDPGRLADIAHRHNALLVLDAIQGLGVLALDMHAQGIDVLVADSRKWMLGPEGAGVIAIRRDVQDLFESTRAGWASTESPMDFTEQELRFSRSATRFESGMHNTFGLTGLHATLRLLKEIPVELREQRLLVVRDEFAEAGRAAGLECDGTAQDARSGIVTFRHPQLETTVLVRQLWSRQISVSLKNDRVRVSPHVYNNSDDADQFTRAVAEVIGGS